MTKPRLLIFDIDGTLLNSKGRMSPNTYGAILRCIESGLLISIATARSGRIVFRDYEIPGDHNILLPRGIFYNGGTVFDKMHGFYQHPAVPGNMANEIVESIAGYDEELQIALQHDDEYHAFKFQLSDSDLVSWGFSRSEVYDFSLCRLQATTKIMVHARAAWHDKEGDLTELHGRLCEKYADTVDIVLADSKKAIYILSKYATKGIGVEKLMKLHGIRPEQVVVFGDDTPDIGMFGVFGQSIAMGNAHESLKAVSTFITKSNDNDGVVYALKEYLKLI